MAWRDPEWLQRGLDALKATLDVEPQLKRDMFLFLIEEGFWDGSRLTDAAAQTKFNACMNPAKPEYFKLTEIWVLMKRFQRHELLHAMAADLGFEPLKLIPQELRREDLVLKLERLRETAAEQEARLLQEIEQLDGYTESADRRGDAQRLRVHPAMRETGVRFSLPEDDGHASGGF